MNRGCQRISVNAGKVEEGVYLTWILTLNLVEVMPEDVWRLPG